MSFLFLPGSWNFQPVCLDACDCNDHGRVVLADTVCILLFLFQFGRFPPTPGQGVGPTTLRFDVAVAQPAQRVVRTQRPGPRPRRRLEVPEDAAGLRSLAVPLERDAVQQEVRAVTPFAVLVSVDEWFEQPLHVVRLAEDEPEPGLLLAGEMSCGPSGRSA